MDKDTLLDEYQRRIQLKIEECKEYGIVFEGDYLKDDLLLTRINKKLKDKKEELAIKKMSLKEYKADQEKQKQLQIKKLQIDREEQIKSLEEIKNKEELKELMIDISKAEQKAEPKTLPSVEEEKLLEDDCNIIVQRDPDSGTMSVTRKLNRFK